MGELLAAVRQHLESSGLLYNMVDPSTVRCGWDAVPRDYAVYVRELPPVLAGLPGRAMVHGVLDMEVRPERRAEVLDLLNRINADRVLGSWVLDASGTLNYRIGLLLPSVTPHLAAYLFSLATAEVRRAATPLLAVSEDGMTAEQAMLFLSEGP